MKTMLTTCLVLGLTSAVVAQNREVDAVKDAYAKALPTEKQLAFYSLDWSENLKEAKKRAAKEGRPIFFIFVTNISAQTNFFSGHC